MRNFFAFIAICGIMLVANEAGATKRGMVAVYRWYDTTNKGYVTVADNEYTKKELARSGWIDKTFLFYAYKKPGKNRVTVHRWYNPVTKASVSVAEDEFTDAQLIYNGYTNKHLQYYGLTRRGANTVCIYRWLLSSRHSWAIIPENGNTDEFIKQGYSHKTYQYYGLAKR